MFNIRLLSKGLGKSYFKRVSEHYFHPNENQESFDVFHKSKLSASGCLLLDKDNAVTSVSKPFLQTSRDVEHQAFKKPLENLNGSTCSNLNLTKILSSLPVVSTSAYHTSCKNLEKPDLKNESVLGSMGIERPEDDKANKESEEETTKKSSDENENKESPFLRSQRYAKWSLLVSFGIGTPLFILQYGAPEYDEFGNEINDKYSELNAFLAYIFRAWGAINIVKRDIIEPSSKKLLPDPLTEPYYQPPYTLVIELTDVFLRPVYDSVSGWRFKKRPGIDYFLSQIGPPLFEVVIFTKETGMTAFPLIESMDQKGYVMYRLFRDAARYKSGFSFGNPLKGDMPKLDPYYQKDLTYLNRDLSKVILVDCDKRACETQPDNALVLDKWDGSSSDTTLYDLAGLLRAIATSNVEDVRPVLLHYAKHEKPIEAFKLAQAKMQQESQYAVQPARSSSVFSGAGNVVSAFMKRR